MKMSVILCVVVVLVDFPLKKKVLIINKPYNENEMSIVLDLQYKSLSQLSVQTNSLEFISYIP